MLAACVTDLPIRKQHYVCVLCKYELGKAIFCQVAHVVCCCTPGLTSCCCLTVLRCLAQVPVGTLERCGCWDQHDSSSTSSSSSCAPVCLHRRRPRQHQQRCSNKQRSGRRRALLALQQPSCCSALSSCTAPVLMPVSACCCCPCRPPRQAHARQARHCGAACLG